MRRVLLFAAFLLLLGLSTAMAASFEVQAEDITSFTTDVSIGVPPTNDVVFYIKNNPDQPSGRDPLVPGWLDSNPPGNNNVDQKQIVHDAALPIDASHTDPTKYHAWQSDPLLDAVTVGGTATLYVSSNGGTNELRAGLFECWTPLPTEPQPATVDVDLPQGVKCALIGAGTSSGGTNSNGYTERTALLPLATTAIEAGHSLRLKIVNNTDATWNLQWGFNPARPSQLQLKTFG